MSLVFLKNDDNSRDNNPGTTDPHLLPYRWSNYFTNPIRVPRNAQVGYIKSSFQQKQTGFVDDTKIFMLQGMPELNPTIPLFLTGGPVSDWKGVLSGISRLCNQYTYDGNFTSDYKTANVVEGVLQIERNYGWNWLITSANRCIIRLDQRPFEDVGNQGWNSGGYNGAAGLNTLNIENVDYNMYAVDSPYWVNSGGVDGVGFPDPSFRVNYTFGSTATTPAGFAAFYDCGWGGFSTSSNGYGIGSGNPQVVPAFDGQVTGTGGKGFFGMVSSRTGIKQYTGGIAPVAQGGDGAGGAGHAFNGSGYCVKTFRNFPQTFGDNDYPAPNGIVANRGLYVGGYSSFGLQSTQMMENMPGATSLSDSLSKYVERMDLNSSVNPTIAEGAVPRYLIGCDIEIGETGTPGEQFPELVVRVLDPDGPPGQSRYFVAGGVDLTTAAAAAGVSLNSSGPMPAGKVPGNLAVRFRWSSPYCIAVEYCFQYLQETDLPFAPGTAGGNPMTEWVLLYDMNQDPAVNPQILIPGYFGDLTLVEYPVGNLDETCRKGFFDYRKSYRILANQSLALDLDMTPLPSTSFYEGRSLDELKTLCINTTGGGTTPTPRLVGLTPETFNADGISQKEVSIVMNPVSSVGDLQLNQTLLGDEYFFLNSPDVHIGDVLGFEGAPTQLNNNIIGPPAVPYVLYGVNGGHTIHLTERVNSLHIQLTNIAIQSQNGVRSTQNKTIAVVATQDAYIQNDPLNSNNIYNDTAPVINWIDLNNYNEIELNKIDVLITYDDNTEATSLENRSDVTIMFRQKPAAPNPSYVPNTIQNFPGENSR